MKIVVDMNLSPKWVDLLQAAGIKAEHWSHIGRGNATDTEIMAFAVEQGCIVLTNDLDFGSLLAATQGAGPSVVQIRGAMLSPMLIGRRVVSVLGQMVGELEAGALVTIDLERTRLRVLPFRR